MTITTREEFEEEDDGEGGDMGDSSSAANYRDELLHDSPFPTNRSTRYENKTFKVTSKFVHRW